MKIVQIGKMFIFGNVSNKKMFKFKILKKFKFIKCSNMKIVQSRKMFRFENV
jgi:hypothetical protein